MKLPTTVPAMARLSVDLSTTLISVRCRRSLQPRCGLGFCLRALRFAAACCFFSCLAVCRSRCFCSRWPLFFAAEILSSSAIVPSPATRPLFLFSAFVISLSASSFSGFHKNVINTKLTTPSVVDCERAMLQTHSPLSRLRSSPRGIRGSGSQDQVDGRRSDRSLL